ncbi:mannose-6-phosphate isomerase [Clostridium tetanomorphum]|uniref:Phosphohexomutase n=1 Tax=Clostridium tetanomorphum TaxID=1553 RepID=A0A923E8E7_CLOTT|nr:type I phosphomannose isomerase catalytic subunit [Clostridium tetanomorphum]KAJ52031.1 mannose-6-phosphate isomerase [Clostridium tetanomorphum DSM 665]MBC2397041.1 class I mannose-6-phosphate isomerase [Clostridium tetanomorphum]MBP1862951.1 mannose-6-phosphate isomerase [Clostridium tetanomorphum]NRS82779.1 mannose-6-phosphate isomerase [Clostridium tetanomorphum]NRS87088.1 mannose-6-phosphate isomerase [Clostridium tetanomorphum]
MFYPLKFKPNYKDYLWGGRNLEKLGKVLPEGIVAESWEVSTHRDGISIIDNGKFKGMKFNDFIEEYRYEALGKKQFKEFPLIIKFIDANNKLSVQVHPNDSYAFYHENGQQGKNEMWYILDAKPGAKLIYDLKQGIDKESFLKSVKQDRIEQCLKYIEVKKGDIINISAGVVHAIGEGILLAEIQQNSNLTYRIYDYNRIDKNGNKRDLHIDKALEVIDFNAKERQEKYKGLQIKEKDFMVTYIALSKYFSLELYEGNGKMEFKNNEGIFSVYTFLEGEGQIEYGKEFLKFKAGESIFIPAALKEYSLLGNFKTLKSYIIDDEEINKKKSYLKNRGYSLEEIIL